MENLNVNNTLITEEDIIDILKKVNINIDKINNISLYIRAFTHKSYVKNQKYSKLDSLLELNEGIVDFQSESYERFEFFGDSVICHTTCEYLFERFDDQDEGFLTKLKTKLVSRDTLCKYSRFLGLSKFILISNHMEKISGRNTDKILEDIFEAFICALYKDQGFLIAKQCIINVMENVIDFSQLLLYNDNYKDRLLQFFQKNGYNPPEYRLCTTLGPPNKRTFIIEVLRTKNDMIEYICKGYGNTKKEAEQDGSFNALKLFNQLEHYEI